MKDLKGETIPIGTLLSREFFFRVPEYQRPFSWEGDNFEDLINDVIGAPREQEYFLGTVVLQAVDGGSIYEVVDGQQRLTSLLVLLACLRDRILDKQFKKDIQEKIVQPENVVDGIPQKVRLEVKDREIFNEVVVERDGTTIERKITELPEPQWRYAQAVGIFSKALTTLNEHELQRLVTFLSQKCVVIYLATSTFDDAFKLFTIVNDRGKQLRRIDVLKSINIAPDVIVSAAVRNRIAQRWEALEKELGESTFEATFHLLRLILLKDKPQGDLLKEFQDRVFAKGTLTKGEPFLNAIFDYVELYKKVFEDKDILPTRDPSFLKFRALIHIMNCEFQASEWRACLLYFAKRFDAKKLFEFCLLIEKVYLGHWFGGVRKDERYATYAKILSSIEVARRPEDILAGITFDENAIKQAVGMRNLYSAGFCRYVLLRLELLASEHDVLKEFNAKSVEHVLPQDPPADGYWAEHHNLAEIKDYVDSVGNLVLLSKSKNSAARNFDFPIKKERYLKSRVSDYPRSIEVLDYDDWDKDTILTRTKEAAALFLTDP